MNLKTIGVSALLVISAGVFVASLTTLNSNRKTYDHIIRQAKTTTTPKSSSEVDKTTQPSTATSNDVAAPTEQTTGKKLSAESAFGQYTTLSQEYLSAYLSQASELKAQPKNIDKNATLSGLISKFGIDGTPDTVNTPTAHLLFDPYVYKNPKMDYTQITSQGDGLYNGVLTVTSEGLDPILILFEYNTRSNTISVINKLTKSTPDKTSHSDVPSSPIFKELE